jgi:hypothetical protein
VSDETITFLVLGAVVAVFVWDRLPVAVVALGTALALWATGVLDLEQALAGFGDPTVLFIASLFVVSEGLEASGVTAWAGQQLLAGVGESRTRLIVLMMLLVALLTALINVNGWRRWCRSRSSSRCGSAGRRRSCSCRSPSAPTPGRCSRSRARPSTSSSPTPPTRRAWEASATSSSRSSACRF